MPPRARSKLLAFVILLATCFGFLFFLPRVVRAFTSSTTGYAWGNYAGWVNWGTVGGGVQASDNSLSGSIWSENLGWINLAPSQSGVLNDGLGNLSGYAWGTNMGWVNFLGVTISATGTFVGTASGSQTGAGVIKFNCSNCLVTTGWTPTAGNPTVGTVFINGGSSTIILIAATTTIVTVSASTTDPAGPGNISFATSTFYRTGLGSGCAANNLNCYQIASSSCVFSGSTSTVTCTANVWYFAQSTGNASSSFPADSWTGAITVTNAQGKNSTGLSSAVNIAVLTAVNIATSSISYGSITPSSTTGAVNQTTSVQNAGNSSSSLQISGTAMVKGAQSISTSSQHYATSSFTFGGSEQQLSGSTASVSGFLLTSPTSTNSVSSLMFWGLTVPPATPTGTYSGVNTFTAVFSS